MAEGAVAVTYYPLHDDPRLTDDEMRLLLGGKGAGLVRMARIGLSVPSGFVVPASAVRQDVPGELSADVQDALRAGVRGVERASGRRLGDPTAPLLLAVRSGAAASMPGMMDTVLNVGMTPAVAQGLAVESGDAEFAWNTFRRAFVSFCEVVSTIERSVLDRMGLDAIIDRVSAEAYLARLADAGVLPLGEPIEQLTRATEAVLASWNSPRANTYRLREGIDDELGTTVTVQAMVFGNLGLDSGTGVAFSRDPSSGARELTGDFLVNAQGEDVVAGRLPTRRLSEMQVLWPAVWQELTQAVALLEHELSDVVDVEFTVEKGRLYLLQCRVAKRSPVAALRVAVDMANDPLFPVDRAEAVRRGERYFDAPPTITDARPKGESFDAFVVGIGASPGRACGVLSLDPDDAVDRAARGQRVILARTTTSPADVHGIAASVGLVSQFGGLVSHAAIVARAWGLPAIVGVQNAEWRETAIVVDGARLNSGDLVTIDGDLGLLLRGEHPVTSSLLPEIEILRAWRHDLTNPKTVELTEGAENVDAIDCLRVLSLKGSAGAEEIADVLGARVSAARLHLEALTEQGAVAVIRSGLFRLTPAGRDAVAVRYAVERNGHEGTFARLLEQFDIPNRALKELVSERQMQAASGSASRDRSDSRERVVAAIRESVRPAVQQVVRDGAALLVRLRRYDQRLEAALQRLAAGDLRFLADPRVDSYHTIWFELHEELIQLAGRTRVEESDAGRA